MNTVAWITSKNEQYDIKDIEARKTKLNIEDLPKNVSAFNNDTGYITNAVNNLLNYYAKSETYNREKINELVSARLLIKIVDKLPTEDISTSTIYFLKRKKEQGITQYESDVYDEYIYVDGTWELIGNTYVDLTDYYTKSETESKIDEKVAVETQNRILADNTLQNNINIVQTNVDDVNNSLNFETATRQNKDLSHETKMSEIERNLNSETVRATNAENNLSSRCDSYDSHVSNTENPHNVTAEQVGLGNVTNVSTTSTITSGSSNNITSGAVYTALSNKVDKVNGKGLSDQNFTYEEKVKLSGLNNYDDTSITSRVSATESAITKLNANSSTSGSVDYKIAKALEGVTSISYEIVSSLPTTGVAGKIYFVKGTGTETEQVYNEYVWLGNSWEKLGRSTAEINLSDIYSKSQVNALVSAKNDKITVSEDYNATLTDESTFTSIPAGENPTTGYTRKLSQVWNYIKGKISSVLGLTATAYGGKASTAGTADKTVNDITINIPFVQESGEYVIPLGNIPEPTSTEIDSPYNWDITGFFSIIRPAGHNGSHLWFEAGHGYSHDWVTYAYLDSLNFRGVETTIKAFQYEGKWWLGLCIKTPNQGYTGKMTITYSRGLPATPTCILYNSRSGGIANEEIYNSIQDIPSSWWRGRTIYNPTTFTQNITAPILVGNLTGDVTGNSATATKAIQDASGNVITDTYATKTELESVIAGDISSKMNMVNPEGTGSFSLNRYTDKENGIGERSVSMGDGCEAMGEASVALGYSTFAHNTGSIAEGFVTHSRGVGSHAEGNNTTASGDASHAEGSGTIASKDVAHAEGYNCTASGTASHAEGYNCTASKDVAHAEGMYTTADGQNSHTSGYYTQTTNFAEFACGQFNKSTKSDNIDARTIFSVGNGNSETDRFNALEVKDNGDVYAKKLYIGRYGSEVHEVLHSGNMTFDEATATLTITV